MHSLMKAIKKFYELNWKCVTHPFIQLSISVKSIQIYSMTATYFVYGPYDVYELYDIGYMI